MLLLFISTTICTVHFVNTPIQPFSLKDTNLKVYIINTTRNIKNENQKQLNIDEIRALKKDIEIIYTNDRIRYDNFIFDSLDKYLEATDGDSHIVILIDFYRYYKFSNRGDLISGGCKGKITSIGPYYFCVCDMGKCGLFCEYKKNNYLIMFGIIGCLGILF
ncbi:hypothetical protein COBT_003543, partial [Conglomerata obtusa]